MRKLYLLILLLWVSTQAFSQTRKMAAVGSSTAGGTGTFPMDSSWVSRFSHYYKNQLGILDTAYRLAVGGYSPYYGMPTGYTPPPGRPGPDPSVNITRAITLMSDLPVKSNGVVIVNYPTNGFVEQSIAEIMFCFQTIYDAAVNAGHKCYIATTQPRSDAANGFNTSAAKKKLADIKDSIINRFGVDNTINFWDGLFNPADTTILATYSAGDNIHLNNAGHRILFERIVAKNVFDLALPVKIQRFDGALRNKQAWLQWTAQHDDANSYFIVQRSQDGVHFESLQQLPVKNGAGDQQYEYSDARPLPGNNFYRLQVTEPGHTYYSKMVIVKNDRQSIVLKKIYPVPALQTLTLELASLQKKPVTIDILNSSGVRVQQFVRRIDGNNNIIILPVGQLPRGSYFIRIHGNDNDAIIESFTK
jgi:hypothetical protein